MYVLLYVLKTLENLRFTDVFREYRKKPLVWIGLTILNISVAINTSVATVNTFPGFRKT